MAALDIVRLRRALADEATLSLFSEVDVVERTESTNADLLARAAADPDAGQRVLLAETQTKARGRHGRRWESPPGAQIAMSLLLRPGNIAAEALGWLPLLTGICVVDALRERAGVPATLKWPNDVLVAGRKLAGILLEIAGGRGDPAIVVGIGVNVSLSREHLPVAHATSLLLEGARCTDRTELAAALLGEFARRYLRCREKGWDTTELAEEYRERCVTLGSEVRVHLPGDTELLGVAEDIDAAGRLLVAGRAVSAGDVVHVRGA